ncbi:MAG: diacylglyceryl transferase, partial [Bacteroidetes bacterium]|nr:diacylglyceryl transferase [Bacteroidota bacterium]
SLKIYSYGLMLGIAFLLGSFVLSRELKRKGLNPALGGTITTLAIIFGIAGAKLLFLLENWSDFMRDPVGMAFSGGGLTWYGGFILAMAVVYFYLRAKKIPFLKVWDGLGVALILAYGVGRIGCHLSGDGDYGPPTTLPWGTIYAQGTAKPTYQLRDYFDRNPDERLRWNYDSLRVLPAGIDRLGHRVTQFDATTPLHPTPIYELLLGVAGFVILLAIRRKPLPEGMVFMIYLLLASTFRFVIEFWRLNPKLIGGFSEAQVLAIALFCAGLAGLLLVGRRRGTADPAA